MAALAGAATGPYQPLVEEVPSNASPLHHGKLARFAPGELLANRYRVVASLGGGGMGEVFRADDLRLGQAVALKFLPAHVAGDPERLARLRSEVRLARQVSQANVCRVYDLEEADGQTFLTMEFIDGQDLAVLLRQVGRLPEERGIDIARQLCLALAAVHDKGVLHRDLKPHNVMIDGRGHVRLTDFGLAAVAADAAGDVCSGTPAYMAPEQLSGKEVTARSDLYALGLVLYEIFTGKRAFEARSREELARQQAETAPSKPSSHVSGLNPVVEGVILRCLEASPGNRPRSAYEVLAGLPGGDPLAAALAAGQTPSPKMVADAPVEGSLHPVVALGLLAMVLGGVVLVAWLNDHKLFRRVPLDKSAHELANNARDVLRQLGYGAASTDQASGFAEDADVLRFLAARDDSAARWEPLKRGRPAALYFWHRTSPKPLLATDLKIEPRPSGLPGWVGVADPPLTVPGMTLLCLDLQGRLIEFHAVPPLEMGAHTPTEQFPLEPDWPMMFEQAGLDWSTFKDHTVPPRRMPTAYCDSRRAWEWRCPETPDIALRVEGGGLGGRLVYWHAGVDAASDRVRADPSAPSAEGEATPAIDALIGVIGLTILTGGSLLARRNLRLGRCNWNGALRLVACFGVIYTVAWAISAAHPLANLGIYAAAIGPFLVIPWIAYLAGEPFVRRRWPWQIISWNRLLEGRWRDPLVGRDVLIGSLAGVALAVLALAQNQLPLWLGLAPAEPLSLAEEALTHGPYYVLRNLIDALMGSLTWCGLLFVLFLIFRRGWLALTTALVLVASAAAFTSEYPGVTVCYWLAYFSITLGLILRVGFLASVASYFSLGLLSATPVTVDLSAWYAVHGLIPAAALASVAVASFFVARGGRPLLAQGWLPDA